MATKKDVSDFLSKNVEGLSAQQSAKIVDALFDHIVDTLKKGEEVKIAGFGNLGVKKQAARKGRNPATGETIEIAAKSKVRFTPAKALKDAVNA